MTLANLAARGMQSWCLFGVMRVANLRERAGRPARSESAQAREVSASASR
jgi:hypothetical protein